MFSDPIEEWLSNLNIRIIGDVDPQQEKLIALVRVYKENARELESHVFSLGITCLSLHSQLKRLGKFSNALISLQENEIENILIRASATKQKALEIIK